nr:Dam family site-specific DNA-(adenine-N6)-methyltransferase [Campylobacter sp.]
MNKALLKWPGGKNWFIQHLQNILPKNFNYKRYVDPFVGGGSVFFALNPTNALLSDINQELITTYEAVRDNCNQVKQALQNHTKQHNKEYYYNIRKKRCKVATSIAARMLYLNHACFNGIYRVNKAGKFNVPIGNNNLEFFDVNYLDEKSNRLQNKEVLCQNYLETINATGPGDFLFCDPPYAVRDNENRFVGYTRNLFSWNDQVQLSNSLQEAAQRGVYILETNVNHPSIIELYQHIPNVHFQEISRYTSISGTRTARTQYSELIITINIGDQNGIN